MVKNPPTNAGDTKDTGLIPELRRSPGSSIGVGNPMDRGVWQVPVHRVARESYTTEHARTVFNSRQTLEGCYYCPNFQTRI